MQLLVFGGTGLIGQAFASLATAKGHTVWIPSRKRQTPQKQPKQKGQPQERVGTVLPYEMQDVRKLLESMQGEYGIVNLAGESIQRRWTEQQKRKIRESRINLTRAIAEAIRDVERKPSVFVSGSAVGYYGTSETCTFTEADVPGEDFLANVTRDWEAAALKAAPDTRVVLVRTGLVLDGKGGALPRMVMPYAMFVGGRIGSGRQWVPWIHIDDTAGALLACVQNAEIAGPVNLVAPNPVRMTTFGKALAATLRRPHWLSVPSFALRAVLGEMSDLVLKGQCVTPLALSSAGYKFRYKTVDAALKSIFRQATDKETKGPTRSV